MVGLQRKANGQMMISKSNVFVVGLPRTGTSLMMRILQTLGVNMVYTTESDDIVNKRDEYYRNNLKEYNPNKGGFFEITRNHWNLFMQILNTDYSGCKIISPLKFPRFDLIKAQPSKVIYMTRELSSLQQSLEKALGSSVTQTKLDYMMDLDEAKLIDAKVDYLKVDFDDLVNTPTAVIMEIAHFIEAPNLVKTAAKLVNKAERRHAG